MGLVCMFAENRLRQSEMTCRSFYLQNSIPGEEFLVRRASMKRNEKPMKERILEEALQLFFTEWVHRNLNE